MDAIAMAAHKARQAAIWLDCLPGITTVGVDVIIRMGFELLGKLKKQGNGVGMLAEYDL